VRRVVAVLLVALVAPALAAAATTAPRLRVVAWASTSGKTGIPPADAVSGGVYCTARPVRKLYAFVRFSGMRDKVASTATWYFNKKRAFVFSFKWEDGDQGRTAFDLYRTKGTLVEGTYTVEIRTGGRLVGSGSVRLRFGNC
jgi:hypothetical protein